MFFPTIVLVALRADRAVLLPGEEERPEEEPDEDRPEEHHPPKDEDWIRKNCFGWTKTFSS